MFQYTGIQYEHKTQHIMELRDQIVGVWKHSRYMNEEPGGGGGGGRNTPATNNPFNMHSRPILQPTRVRL
jgi:hypothetical protein